MTLSRVQVSDFRCLRSAELQFGPRFTLISGPNASGKTSLLEAIYLLGRGRSFRTRKLEHLIRMGAPYFRVVGETILEERRILIGVEGTEDGIRARMGGERVPSLGALAAVLPVQIIDPEVHRLIEEGPSQRRRFVDWGVFHVEQNFVDQWRRFQLALKQRNAALRGRQSLAVVSAWDGELIRFGEWIDQVRSLYVSRLAEAVAPIGRALLGLSVEISYRSGWNAKASFARALAESWSRDSELGSTTVGPQRAELIVRVDGVPARERISRGQQKLLAAALLVAQISLFPKDAAARPVLLLDDPAAELDDQRLRGLVVEVAQHAAQLIITSLTPEFIGFGNPERRYEILRGEICER